MGMKRIILITICAFALLSCIAISCKKSDFGGCNNKTKQFTCTINTEKFSADSSSCSYDTISKHVYLYARDTSKNALLLFSVYYPLQDMDIILKPKDSLLSGKVVASINGKYFESKHGNLGLSKNDDNTVCGQFFFNDDIAKVDVSVGKFTDIPWVYWKP
jgi:hypothetical protein